ncbi:hypothetical protein IKE71_03430 [Candidatus Saccharibacteria bacterium]|nr:hypothetical protein [Candidatus Saccharibacteria bacterium]
MRSRFFEKKIKPLAAVFFSALLILPSVLNVVKFTTPVAAAPKTYTVVATDGSGKAIDFGQSLTVTADVGDTMVAQLDVLFCRLGSDCDNKNYHAASVYSAAEMNNSDYRFRLQTIINGETRVVVDDLTFSQISGVTLRIVDENGNTVNGFQSKTDVTGIASAEPVFQTSMDGVMLVTTITDTGYKNTSGSSQDTNDSSVTQEEVDSGKVEASVGFTTEVKQTPPERTKACSIWAGLISWIVCSLVSGASGAMNLIYEKFIEPMLQVDPDILNTDSGTYSAWGYFRDIANVALVIYLLVIILSQVTGLGIDNYGIKKSLPRLIAAAIMINLSFLICQLAVDLSNIIGQSIGTIFESAVSGAPSVASYFEDVEIGQKVGIAAAFATAAAAGVVWVVMNPLITLTAIIGGLISYLFIFLILAVRWVLVILLVVIAPVAFICYSIPNLKNGFDRWWRLFRTMLFLYPNCAICISGGRLASRIILATALGNSRFDISFSKGALTGGSILSYFGAVNDIQGVLLFVVAIVAEVGPYFMIPSLTRSSMQLAGNIGARISQYGNRLGGNAASGIRNSRAGKRFERNRTLGRMRRRATRFERSAARSRNGTSFRGIRGNIVDRWRMRAGSRENNAEANKTLLADEQRQRDVENYTNQDFIQGERAKSRLVERQRRADAESYTDQNYVEGKLNESILNVRGDRARVGLYANSDYVTSRRNAQDAAISNENVKIFADQFSRMGINEVIEKLDEIIKLPAGTQNHAEQLQAAIQTLVSVGQADKVRDVLSDSRPEYAGNAARFAALTASDVNFRNRAASTLGASGDIILQEYSKHLGKEGEHALSFQAWSNSTDLRSGKSLAASVYEKGLDRFDKDGIKYLGSHLNALTASLASADSNVSTTAARNYARFASGATDPAVISALASVSNNLRTINPTTTNNIRLATSGAQLANMNNSIRISIANPADWKAQLGDAIAANPQLQARFTASELPQYANINPNPPRP